MRGEQSVRRRGPIHRARILASSNMCFHITKYTYPIRQIPAFISSNTYLTIIKHTHSFHQIRISLPHFVGVYVYAGTINRLLQLLTVCQQRCEQIAIHTRTPTKYHTFALQKPYFCNAKTHFSQHKNHTFATQKPTFRTTKTILSQRKNPLFAPQKTIGDKLGGSQKRFVKIIIIAETNISHTQNKTLSSLLEYHFLNHYNRLYRVRITV